MPKINLTYTFDTEEEMRAFIGVGETTATPEAPEAPVTQTEPVEEQRSDDAPTADSVDCDGMPYDASVHSNPPAFTANGQWRAMRGKAHEAKTARAAFKAGGGAVEAPAVTPDAALPGAPALPGTTALPESAPEPISYEKVVEKITGMMGRGTLTNETVAPLYVKHGGDNPAETLSVNETARAALYAELCTIEPELS